MGIDELKEAITEEIIIKPINYYDRYYKKYLKILNISRYRISYRVALMGQSVNRLHVVLLYYTILLCFLKT